MTQKTTSKHGKHKRITIACHTCGYLFERQARRVKENAIQYCRACKARHLGKITFWPSQKLREVIEGEGTTYQGTDYEKYLPEIKEEYYKRLNKALDAQMNEYEIRNDIDVENECPF